MPDPTPTGTPTWERAEMKCPNCAAQLCVVKVAARMPQLRGGEGVCTYFGCPACPYASPSVTTAASPREPTQG